MILDDAENYSYFFGAVITCRSYRAAIKMSRTLPPHKSPGGTILDFFRQDVRKIRATPCEHLYLKGKAPLR
jgi:hypothetical protein